jgi:metallophosphoesterase superfamily enzyme
MTDMQPLTIINDTHVGAVRSAGTTPLTAWQLRQYALEEFEKLVDQAGSLVILGDLFDTGHVPMADILRVWEILRAHCASGAPLYLVQGNHDLEKTLTTLSSFQFLCKLLEAEFPANFTAVTEPKFIHHGSKYVIPHLANQDLFDAALAAVPECDYLMVHCNYDNKFAVNSDHSLNLSLDQAMACKAKYIIFAHEHQARTALGGKVFVAGNQFPTSIADCLGNHTKYLTQLTGVPGAAPVRVETWSAVGNYVESDWRIPCETNHKFIRVVGEASAAEAAEVVSAISKFRNKSKALVITNAVKIDGVEDGEQIKVSLEEVKSFDVLGALLECLDEREQGVVKKLLGEAA